MPDPGALALAYTILKDTSKALKALRERAQSTNDIDIKAHVGDLYDNVNSLKEVISRLADENADLKQQLDQQQHPPEVPARKDVGKATYYYLKNGTDGPYCQPCYDDKRKLIALQQPIRNEFGHVSRFCLVCRNTFYEII